MGGLGIDKRTYIHFGRAYFVIYVIFSHKRYFLCWHCFKHFSKSTILGSKFSWNIILPVQKVHQSELASFKCHLIFLTLIIQFHFGLCYLFAFFLI